MNKKELIRAFRAAFPYTSPILAGFLFIGLGYGVYMNVSGFSFWYPMLMSLFIFAGSVEFVAVNLLLGAFAPLEALIITLILNSRHFFYGISMLEKFKNTGYFKPYLIYGMCDESFSINYTADIPEDVNKKYFMFWVTVLNHFYWVLGATLGGIFGSLIAFNTQGIEFVMTALFVVIFLDQWTKSDNHFSAWAGLGAASLSLAIFGADNFMIPSMVAMLTALSLPYFMQKKEALAHDLD